MASQASFVPIPVCPILASRKGEVFAALFRRSRDEGMTRLTEETSFKLESLSSFIREETLFIGNDWRSQGPALADILGSRAQCSAQPSHLLVGLVGEEGPLAALPQLSQSILQLRETTFPPSRLLQESLN